MIYMHPRESDTSLEKCIEDNKDKLGISRYHNKVEKDPSDFKRKSMTYPPNGRMEILRISSTSGKDQYHSSMTLLRRFLQGAKKTVDD